MGTLRCGRRRSDPPCSPSTANRVHRRPARSTARRARRVCGADRVRDDVEHLHRNAMIVDGCPSGATIFAGDLAAPVSILQHFEPAAFVAGCRCPVTRGVGVTEFSRTGAAMLRAARAAAGWHKIVAAGGGTLMRGAWHYLASPCLSLLCGIAGSSCQGAAKPEDHSAILWLAHSFSPLAGLAVEPAMPVLGGVAIR